MSDEASVLKIKRRRNFLSRQMKVSTAGVLSQGGAGGAMHPQILADQLTLSQPVGADYAHKIILATPNFQTFLRP